MHEEDLFVIGVAVALLLLLAPLVAIFVVWNRKRRRELEERFDSTCAALGLTWSDGAWYGERVGVPVSVSWRNLSLGVDHSAQIGHFGIYVARFEPPLETGIALYTGVERFLNWRGQKEIHLPRVNEWNDLPLSFGGCLRDVREAPERATVTHVDIPNQAVRQRICVYAREPQVASRLLQGKLAEMLVQAAETSGFLWMDDCRLVICVQEAGPLGANVTSSISALDTPPPNEQQIERWFAYLAELARNIRGSLQVAAG